MHNDTFDFEASLRHLDAEMRKTWFIGAALLIACSAITLFGTLTA